MVGLRAKRPHFTEKWLRFTLHFVAHFYSARNNAGNTSRISACSSIAAVHPRSRGEHGYQESMSEQEIGSSPLTRGTRVCRLRLPGRPGSSPLTRGTLCPIAAGVTACRFIPAHAGNTSGNRRVRSRPTVHPRSRGEHLPVGRIAGSGSGSSPLTRGTLQCRKQKLTWRRFIPAHAGNTLADGGDRVAHAVHPRSRGEHT